MGLRTPKHPTIKNGLENLDEKSMANRQDEDRGGSKRLDAFMILFFRKMSWIQNLKNWERLQETAEYMKQVYGDPQAYLHADTTKFVTEREYYGDFGYGECFNSSESGVQCEIITGTFDPKLLPYDKRMAWHFKEFCYKTSAHGIPMIGQAPNRIYR
ncbi:hypothetical protein COOONC_02984 [Cooperia oncophora]